MRGWSLVSLFLLGLAACGGDDGSGGDGGPGTVSNMPDSGVPVEGIPDAAIPTGMAPPGCELGATADSHKLELALTSEIAGVRLAVVDGKVLANDVPCTTKDGANWTAANTREIHVDGTSGDDLVVVDLSTGGFGPMLLAAKPGIVIALGEGHDEVGLVATVGDDDIALGTQGGNAQLRFAKEGVQLNAANVEAFALSLGPGNDKVDASGGGALGSALAIPLRVFAGDGADQLQGGAGDDMLSGGGGNDTFLTAASADGDDTYDGGDDVDTVSYDQRTASITVTIDDLPGDGEGKEQDNVLTNVENLIGGRGDDDLTGSPFNNEISGGEGDDTLSGGDGDDTFHEGGTVQGTDVVHGGNGSDTMDYGGRSGDIHVAVCQPSPAECTSGACGCANDSGTASEHDTLVGVENVISGSGNDELSGDDSDNAFVAGEGDDTLSGGAGDDTLYGDAGNDHLLGGTGEDLLYGGSGTDELDAGPGQGDICVFQEPEVALNCELK